MALLRGLSEGIASNTSSILRRLSAPSGFLRQCLVSPSNTVASLSLRLNPGSQLQFVRYATKKAASSRTNDKNSKGKRLGLKKAEGSRIKVGQIIFRQRGTQWFPGENAGIGRDHTIFALEPGFVRYYRDPFHPTRRLVGVSLAEDIKLPTSHWQPRLRRFGRYALSDPVAIETEKNRVSRKEYYGRIKKAQLLEERLAKKKGSASFAEASSA